VDRTVVGEEPVDQPGQAGAASSSVKQIGSPLRLPLVMTSTLGTRLGRRAAGQEQLVQG
jgi:hypothetical protein